MKYTLRIEQDTHPGNPREEYDQYLRCEVYGYIIEDEDGNHVDSCWGYYGGEEYARSVGESQLECFIHKDREQAELAAIDEACLA